MSRLTRLSVVLLSFSLTGVLLVMADDPPAAEQRRKAQAEFNAGNFRDALVIFRKLVLNPANTGAPVGEDLNVAVQCLQRLQQQHEIDKLLADALAVHPDDWHVYWRAGTLIGDTIEHYGFLTAGDFIRGNQRGGGVFIDVTERDRAQSLIWLNQARLKMPENAPGVQKAELFQDLANGLMQNGGGSWRLQSLTSLETLPDYPEPTGRFYGRRGRWGGSNPGAPVDTEGQPIFYSVPASFEAAKNDGERWRWCLQQVGEFNLAKRQQALLTFANFLHEQFGVQTLTAAGIQLPRGEDDQKGTDGVWSLPTLPEDETIARLANGVKRFRMPDEFNYIKLYRDIAASNSVAPADAATGQLVQVFENRQQYPKAAQLLKDWIARSGDHGETRANQLQQIVGNWGQFEPVSSEAAGTGAKVDYRFRNGKSVSFTARKLKVAELISDIQAYLASNPEQVDWQKIQIDQLGYRIVQQDETKYVGEEAAKWTLDLQPRPDHFDRRVTVTTPLQQAGAYLVVAKMADGNESRIILWLNDTAIVKKPLSDKVMYFVADAVSGQPVEGAHVEFFGWQQQYQQKTRKQQLQTQKFAETTNAEGMLLLGKQLLSENYQWIAVAKTKAGRFAYLGFSGVWFQKYHTTRYDEVKVYIVTDRPVYRPDQKVQFKFWVREADYGPIKKSLFANMPFQVKINDPLGNQVFEKELKSDEFGGLSGEYALPKGAPLGEYSILLNGVLIDNKATSNSSQFRVEEYKKPEFEVTVAAPELPVPLGDKITATIKAKYYYGAPVTQATVKFKVERTSKETTWFPSDPWDWLYGNGYWWYSPDYNWYPGFRVWGCLRPVPPWFHWQADPPELVLEQEVKIGADGTVKIEIDSALAKLLHGDQDHEYKITAEVTDASRRTIVGQGNVLVSREPYKVFAWTDRGYYNVDDTIKAEFQARSLDGNGVQGSGKVQLLKISYASGKPVETVVQTWDVATNDEGHAEQTLKASEPGQYRLAYKMQTAADAPVIEGGYLFIIRGQGFNGDQFQFNDLELIVDQKHFAPGDKARLLINTNRTNATVLLFIRPVDGIAKTAPQVLKLNGKSTVVEIDVAAEDMPNFFVEAITIARGEVHDEVREFMVPPERRVLNVEVIPSAERYLPGQKADIDVKVTDRNGQPFSGSLVLTVYDRAVEYISGGSNVADIKEFFWKWQREHHPNAESNLGHLFQQIVKQGDVLMQDLGVFGGIVAGQEVLLEKAAEHRFSGGKQMRGLGGAMADGMALGLPMAAAAPKMWNQDAAVEESAVNPIPKDGTQAAPAIRSNFADTAFWKADFTTDKDGLAKVSFDMPENLSGWKIRAWGLGEGTAVGEGTKEVVTAKNLIVRLQAPRFFVERDEVVLSAIVQNNLKTEKKVEVQLALEGEALALMTDRSSSTFNLQPSTVSQPSTLVTIPPGGEARVDWLVKAVKPGTATVTMKAITDEESDAMQMTFPVEVHGLLKTESYAGVIRPDADKGTVEFNVPEDRQPDLSRLEVRFSPTLAGAMVDALPYLPAFPYGCTEQTLNRFVPTVITQKILLQMGLDLKAIQAKRTNLNAQELGDPAVRAAQWKRFDSNPVFDPEEVALMVKTGVKDLTSMQNSDGGWGWFSGSGESSYPHTTTVVVHGLQVAAKNDVALAEGMLENGIAWLKKYQSEQVALLQEGERHEKDPNRKERYRSQCSEIDAFVFSVLVDGKVADAEMQRFLYRDRNKLALYSQALLGLALHELNAIEQRDMVVKNIDQFLKTDPENQTTFLDLPNDNTWWYWYGNQVEANAFTLKLLSKVDPKGEKASGLAKYLINNRKHGSYWTSTRDTAFAIEALADYLLASGESKPNMLVEVWLDGQLKKTVEITPEVLFTFDNTFTVEGEALTSGKHTLELRRKPLNTQPSTLNPLYYNAYVTNFTKEDPITAAGLEVKVGRKFYKLTEDKDATAAVPGSRGQVIDQKVVKYIRTELKSLDKVTSGDLVEIELEIDSKNDYEYLIFEDFKAAGCEPVDVRSGYTQGGLGAYVEFRDEKVAFFLRQLARGKHSVSYRVRAEIPGQFSALPTAAHAMYAPELKGNSDEMKLRIGDR